MKHRRILIGCVVAMLLLGTTAAAFAAKSRSADPTVVLDAKARQFNFQNVTPYDGNQYPNLFQDQELTAVMPGDQIAEDIVVTAENLEGGYADIFLSAESLNSDITSQEAADFALLMEQGALTVSWTGSDGAINHDKLETDDPVKLGTFHEGDSITVTVNYGLPIEAGNELQNLRGEVGWVFQAQIYEGGPPKPGLDTENHVAYIIGKEDGKIYPGKNITRAEVAAIFFRLLNEETRAYYWAESNPFYDVPASAWYFNEVSTLTNAGILYGRTADKFAPNAAITRAEAITVCSRFFQWEKGTKTFTDIKNHWARDAIESAASQGVISGYPDGTFRPDKLITRAEFIKMMNGILNRAPHKDHLLPDMVRWPDNMDTNQWYYADVQEATNSHDYTRGEDDEYEVWTKILPPPDWNALEKEWSDLYSKTRQIVDSRMNADFR